MLKFDNSYDVVSLIAFIALVSPIITAIVDNGFKFFLKRQEHHFQIYDNEYVHKRELFERFLEYSGKLPQNPEKYTEPLMFSYFSLAPYIPQKDWEYFREYCDIILEGNTSENIKRLSQLFNDHIVPCIKKELIRKGHLKK